MYDRNARPPADPRSRTESSRTSSAVGINNGLATPGAASAAGDLPGMRSCAVRWLEVLPQLRHETPMPIVQHAKSWKELLPQLWHASKILEY